MTQITEKDVRDYISDLKTEFPKLKIHEDKPWWLNAIFKAPLLKKLEWFNYTQTIGMNIWFSDRWDSFSFSGQLCTLKHEREHLLQFQKYGLLGMAILYLFIFFPIGLAYYRAKFEREGCYAGMKARIEYYGDTIDIKESSKNNYLRNLTSRAYLYAWPFKKTILRWFAEDWTRATSERK